MTELLKVRAMKLVFRVILLTFFTHSSAPSFISYTQQAQTNTGLKNLMSCLLLQLREPERRMKEKRREDGGQKRASGGNKLTPMDLHGIVAITGFVQRENSAW